MKCPNCGKKPFKFGYFITSLSLTHHCANCQNLLEPNIFIICSLPTTILAAIIIGYVLLVWPPEALVHILGAATVFAAFSSAALAVIFGLAVMYRFGRYKSTNNAGAKLKD